MLEHLKKYKLILASQSPRRRNLLKMLDLEFKTTSVDVDEVFDDSMNPWEAAIFLAEKKAGAFIESEGLAGKLVITADTLVCLEDKILGKPKDYEDARKMLKELSGHWHKVVSGVCIVSADLKRSFSSETDVHFKNLSDAEIHYYIDHYKPYDKAGAYGIQEWIGHIGIDNIKGSFYNVMGLPVQKLYEELMKF